MPPRAGQAMLRGAQEKLRNSFLYLDSPSFLSPWCLRWSQPSPALRFAAGPMGGGIVYHDGPPYDLGGFRSLGSSVRLPLQWVVVQPSLPAYLHFGNARTRSREWPTPYRR